MTCTHIHYVSKYCTRVLSKTIMALFAGSCSIGDSKPSFCQVSPDAPDSQSGAPTVPRYNLGKGIVKSHHHW